MLVSAYGVLVDDAAIMFEGEVLVWLFRIVIDGGTEFVSLCDVLGSGEPVITGI